MPDNGRQRARICAARRRRILRNFTLAGVSSLVLSGASAPALAQGASSLISSDIDATGMVWLGALGGVCAFAVTAAVSLLRHRKTSSAQISAMEQTNRDLRLKVDRLESMLERDDQKIIVWSGDGRSTQVWGVLPAVCGVPKSEADLLAFAGWLIDKSAATLEEKLDRLFQTGEAFSITLRTRKDTYVEAVGRTSGVSVVLRLRDLTGERQSQAELAARNARISGELQLLHGLLDSMPAPAWQRDAEGKITWTNSAYAAAVDAATPEAAIQQNAALLDAAGRDAVARERDDDGRFRARLPVVAAGERRIFDITDVNTNVGSAGIAVDTSELARVNKELTRVEDFHGRTLDQLATAVAIFGGDKKLQFYNAAFRHLWDLDPAFLDCQPEDGALLDALRAARKLPEQADYRVWRNKMLDSYQSLEAQESWWHLPDGRTLRVIANPHPQGGVTYIYENVTERLDLESRYNALIRVQGETLDNLSEAVAVFGSDGRLRLRNPAFGTIWGISEDQLNEMPHVNHVVGWCAAREDEIEAWQQLAQSVTGLVENRTHLAGRMERRDGSVLDYATVPLPDGGTLVTFVDVTDSVNVERALVEKNEALEQADELKNAFVQHVSYELRSPLTNIIGFAQLLSDPKFGELSDKQGEYADYILSSSSALLAIINDILDLATLDAGIMELDLGEVDLARTVEAAAEGLQDRIAEAEITLRTHVPQDIGTLFADEKRLRQVLFNLIANAVRYSREQGVVDVACSREADKVIFTVKDRGFGIPQDMIDQVFNRFVGNDTGARRQGAGLGLSIVKSFVELHGGTVEIDSMEGEGTTVICQFPAAPDTSGRIAAE